MSGAAAARLDDLFAPIVIQHAPGGRLRADFTGFSYIRMMGHLHEAFGVRRYFEIGTRGGASVEPARGAAVCVDPAFILNRPVHVGKTALHLYQMTSDAYFAAHDPKQALGGPIEMAFIDGMHHYDYVLRDFANTEPHCARDGLILLHDGLPYTHAMARRLRALPEGGWEPVTFKWSGDVWKVLPILARWRPDLRITLLDCVTVGLVVVSNLDPASTVLRDNMSAIVAARDAEPDTEAALVAWLAAQRVMDSRRAVASGRLRALLTGR